MSDNTNKFAVHQLLELQQQMLMAAQQQNNAEVSLGLIFDPLKLILIP